MMKFLKLSALYLSLVTSTSSSSEAKKEEIVKKPNPIVSGAEEMVAGFEAMVFVLEKKKNTEEVTEIVNDLNNKVEWIKQRLALPKETDTDFFGVMVNSLKAMMDDINEKMNELKEKTNGIKVIMKGLNAIVDRLNEYKAAELAAAEEV
ncbi:hypothetical protein GINT2_001150 [Glugoides intestinalis]